MWNKLLSLHNLVYGCLKIVLIVLIVNSVETNLRFLKIEIVVMNASILRDYTKISHY